MVKRSTKSKSKRTSIRKKHKIAEKVKAHNRKQRRQQRKKAKENKAKGIRAALKDPGVPALWPMREEFLKEMAFERHRIVNEKKLKKEKGSDVPAPAEQRATGDVEMKVDGLQELAQEAQRREDTFQQSAQSTLSADPQTEDLGGREYFKDFRKVVSLADVILQVLDARDPEGCRSKEVEELVQKFTPQKRLVFLLNKIDLVPREVVVAWLKYLRRFAPTIAFRCSIQRQSRNLGQSRNRALESKSSVCLGADNLIQLLKNYTRNADIKTAITVGLVGVPNVGKSSVINSLKRSRAVHVGNRPGVTTHIQEVHLDKQIRLLDSPGVIYERKQGQLQGVIKAESLVDPIGTVETIAAKVQPEILRSLYKIEDFSDVQSFLILVARKTGKLKKGGIPDTESAAKTVIKDWNNGKIPFYTLPPSQPAATEVQVVEQWGPDFSLEGLNDAVLELLHEEDEPEMEMDVRSEVTQPEASSGALEAFGRMASIQEARSQIKNATAALTGMHLMDEHVKDEAVSTQEQPSPEEEPTVKVLHRKGQKKKHAKGASGPINDSSLNRTKPAGKQGRVQKKRAKKALRRMKAVTTDLVEKFKL